ncbi:MAG: RsmB/NOP family class I SAM-dependent RNA methyltransferase [Myxococcota bacterium]
MSSFDPRPGAGDEHRIGRVWDRVLEALAIAESIPMHAAIGNVERRHRDLGKKERDRLRSLSFALVRNRRRLESEIARASKAEKKRTDLEPPVAHRLLLYAGVAQGLDPELPDGALDLVARQDPPFFRRFRTILERLASDRIPKLKATPQERLAIECNLPSWIVESWQARIGLETASEWARALAQRAPLTVVPRGLGRDEALEQLRRENIDAAPTSLSPLGIQLPRGTSVDAWEAPAFIVQDEGSQLVALAAVESLAQRAKILDACAGAGGKSLVLRELRPAAKLVCVEPDGSKQAELRRRIGEQGQLVKERLEDWAPGQGAAFDAVLVDAPCTGSGTLRRHPDLSRRLSKETLEKERHRQRILLTAAFGTLKPGGRLVYATCSMFHEENEDVVQAFGSDVPDARPESVFGGELGEKLGRASSLRIGPGPDEDGPDGFFMAAFRKSS